MTSGPRTDRGATSPVAGLVLCGGRSRRMGADKARLELAGRTLLEHAVAIVGQALAGLREKVRTDSREHDATTGEPVPAACAARAPQIWLACGAEPRYAELGLPLALDRAPHLGPLAGLEAGLRAIRAAREQESAAPTAGVARGLQPAARTIAPSEPHANDRGAEAQARADEGSPCRAADVEPEAWVLVLACDMPSVDPTSFERLLTRAIVLDLDVCLVESAHGLEPLCGVYSTRVLATITAALDAGESKATAFARFPLAGAAHGRAREPRVGSLGDRRAARPATALNLNTPEDLSRARAAGLTALNPARGAVRKETA